jgi:uncharacterized protein
VPDRLTADRVIELLGLRPLPREGGWFAETWRGPDLPPAATPHLAGIHAEGTAIYYLVTPGAFSAMHRLPTDEVFHAYLGDPVDQLHLLPGGTGRLVRLGSDLAAGQRPQVVAPAGAWQGARLVPGGAHGYALLGTTMAPGYAGRTRSSPAPDPSVADRGVAAARRARLLAGLAAVAPFVLVAALLVARGQGPSDPAPGAPVVVAMTEMAYAPAEIVVPADRPVTLLLRNVGSLQHDFSVDALRLSPDARPGEQRTVEIVAPAGRYEVYCSFPGHRAAGMTATLVAQP